MNVVAGADASAVPVEAPTRLAGPVELVALDQLADRTPFACRVDGGNGRHSMRSRAHLMPTVWRDATKADDARVVEL